MRTREAPPRGEPGRAGPNVVFGVEPVSELVAAAPHSIEVLHVRAGDERRFSAAAERVRAAGGRVVIATSARCSDRLTVRESGRCCWRAPARWGLPRLR